MAGIYIHIPFCKQRCLYCAFYSSTLHSRLQEYCDALCRELEMRRNYIIGIVDTVYFGGGTPSTLTHEQLQKILGTIKRNYTLSPSAEITIEANPDDLTPEYLTTLRSLSFNRLSMGIQSFDDTQLKALGRRHTAERARQAVEDARVAGFNNISIDLMFALPSSTHAQWQESIQQAISLHPTHISAYNLTYEEETPLYRALQQGKINAIDEDENLKQFETLIDTLSAAGYRHYEISNFALPGYESRHNSSYWHDIPYLGCGASAHSYNGKERSWNVADIELYIRGIETGNPDFEIEHLSENERYNDAIVTRLRTADGLPLEWFRHKFNKKLYDYLCRNIAPHIADGTLQESNGCVSLTHEGIFISDSIMRDLIYIE
ncbi:MAG: radical SAM family heme chaperone HemW [Bacteroidaceae bacterium]|nr:radical SAM family heme chaperone HemW [Bacteroidaceae bacterium]